MNDDADNEVPNHGDGAAADPRQRIRKVAATPIGATVGVWGLKTVIDLFGTWWVSVHQIKEIKRMSGVGPYIAISSPWVAGALW